MDTQYLAQLKEQQIALENILQVQQDAVTRQANVGVRIAIQIYIDILDDALKMVNSLIQYMDRTQTRSSG